jgi:hypothetical protein
MQVVGVLTLHEEPQLTYLLWRYALGMRPISEADDSGVTSAVRLMSLTTEPFARPCTARTVT